MAGATGSRRRRSTPLPGNRLVPRHEPGQPRGAPRAVGVILHTSTDAEWVSGRVEHDDIALISVRLEVTGHGAQRVQARLGLIEVVDPEFEMNLHWHVLLRPGRWPITINTTNED
jgi:hypothetical protein